MVTKIFFLCIVLDMNAVGVVNAEEAICIVDKVRSIGEQDGFKPFEGNPVISPGGKGEWDAGALGSMTVLKVDGVFHVYYEAWGVRSEKEWDAKEYESLQVGHATSRDGVHWTNDPQNPVLPHGAEGEWDG